MRVIKSKHKLNSGFTLVELIVVLLVLSILALIAIPRYQDVLETTRTAHDLSEAKVLSDSIYRAVARGDYRITDNSLEKRNAEMWQKVEDVISEMEIEFERPIGSPETGEQYGVKITKGKLVILVDENPLYPE